MSRRSLSWLPLVLVAALLLQALTPVLPAPTLAQATEATSSNAAILDQPRLLNLRLRLITLGAHLLTSTSTSTSTLLATFDSPLPPPTPDPLGTRLPVFDSPLPLPTPAPESRPTLRLEADPAWVEPGQSVTFTLTAENTGNASLPELTLTNALPEGLLYVTQSAAGFSYDAPARRLTWPAGELAAGAVSTGSFQARVQGRAIGETITTTVTAASPALAAAMAAAATLAIVPPRNNETWATPGEGGLLRSADDRVLLRIPPGAVQARVKFVYTVQPTVPDPPAGLRFAFRVKAQAEDGQVAFSYGADGVVATRTVTDLVTGTANQWSYSYTDKLYDGWNVVGYAQVTETLPSSLGAGNTINHHFTNGNGVDAGFRGKEDQQSVTVGGVKQQEVTRVWTGTTAGVYGGGKLVYLSAERQLTYDKDGQNPQTRKTTYFYDLDHQGNAQYGNLTRSKDYSDDGVTLYRTTERWFYPKVDVANGKYIVNRVGQAKLWDDANVCQGQTRQIYDTTGFNQQQTPPTQGLLKEVWQAKVCDSTSQSDWVRQTLNGYNSYGNLTSATAANGAVTSTSYDTVFGTYPLSVTVMPGAGGGATLTTSYAYYGVNPEPGGSGLAGQLQQETDPNAAATRYSYDAFGRALALRQPGAAFSNPATEQLTYTDAAPYSVKHALRDDANGDTSSTATYLDAWTFYDGLGQVLQTQAEGATSSQSVVVSQQANALGAVIGATPPYIGTTPGVYQPFNWTTPPQPVTRTVYDSLGRVMQVTQPDGSVVKTFYHGRQDRDPRRPGPSDHPGGRRLRTAEPQPAICGELRPWPELERHRLCPGAVPVQRARPVGAGDRAGRRGHRSDLQSVGPEDANGGS